MILVKDEFTDINNTPLSAHIPNIGGAWGVAFYGSGAKVVGNQAVPIAAGNDYYAHANATSWGGDSYSKIQLTKIGTVAGVSTVIVGLFLRQSNNSNYYRAYWETSAGTPAHVVIDKRVGGGFTTLADVLTSITLNSTYEFQVKGNNLIALRDGSIVASGSATDFTTGKSGFTENSRLGDDVNGANWCDNFEAGTLGGGPSRRKRLLRLMR